MIASSCKQAPSYFPRALLACVNVISQLIPQVTNLINNYNTHDRYTLLQL